MALYQSAKTRKLVFNHELIRERTSKHEEHRGAYTPSFFGLEQDLLYCGLEGAGLVLLQHLPAAPTTQSDSKHGTFPKTNTYF